LQIQALCITLSTLLVATQVDPTFDLLFTFHTMKQGHTNPAASSWTTRILT